MKPQLLNSVELYNILNPPSMGAKVSDTPAPAHPVPGQGVAGQFTRTDHKENTNDLSRRTQAS